MSSTLPAYAGWRYTLDIARHKGRASITLTDRQTRAQITHADVQVAQHGRPHRVAENTVDAVVRDMIRFADSKRPAGDPIGEAARAAIAVSRLRRMHTEAAEHLVDPVHYPSVLEHVADIAGALVDLGAMGAEMCETYEGMCLEVDEREGAAMWREAQFKLGNVRAGARGANKAAASAAGTVERSIGYMPTCGDCVEGTCHWGGALSEGGRLGEARRRAAAGESCGCSRHDVSVRVRRASPPDPELDDDGVAEVSKVAGVYVRALGEDVDAVGAVARVVGEWYGRRVDPAGGLIGRVAAWASGAGLVPVGELADDLDAVFTAGGPETLRDLEARIKNPPVVLARFDDDVAERILTGWFPYDHAHRLEHDTWFVNASGRPLPRYGVTTAAAELDDAQRAQLARELYALLQAELGDPDDPFSVAGVGAALFDVPGFDGPLLVPAGADLAMICIRLHVSVAFERETRPDDVVIIDDQPAPSGPPAAVLAKLAARGMVELDAGALLRSDTMRLEVPETLAVPCGRPLNVCPEHGATLYVVGGEHGGPVAYTACKRSGCMRTWPNDRLGTDCDQLAMYSASAPEASPDGTFGPEVDVCRHHADQLIEWGWSVRSRRPAGTNAAAADALDAALALRCRAAARRGSVVAAARALLVGLGYTVRDTGDGTPSYEGVFPDVVLAVSGPMFAEVRFVHDGAIDVFLYSDSRVSGVLVEVTPMPSWPALVETLALKAGRELPAFVLAAREADGGVELAAEALAAHVDPVIALDFTAGLSGSPMDAAEVEFTGYGRRYAAAFRHDPSAFGLVFAGAWALDRDGVEVPSTWSTWPAFLAHVTQVAEGAADAID